MLAVAQACDLLTTQVDMERGGVEANQVAANLMEMGGLAMLWFVKFALVAAMALAAVLTHRYWQRHGNRRSALAQALVWRGLQVCVVVLAVTAARNVSVLAQIAG